MDDYERINNEIHRLLNVKNNEYRSENPQLEDKKAAENVNQVDYPELQNHLEKLVNLYDDINGYIRSGDKDGLKEVLLKDEIKASLVCESLIKVLRDVCKEKQDVNKMLEDERSRLKKFENERIELTSKVTKLENDLSFLKSTNDELVRVIKDQKYLVSSNKDKAELEKKNSESVKNINKELELLKDRAVEKCNVLEKEIKILKDRLVEKDTCIKSLTKERQKELQNAEALSKKVTFLENSITSLKKKIEIKDKALDICNAELSNIILRNKKNESDVENFKDKAVYYERLYNATNKQNEYLNEQLSRMINMENIQILETPPNTSSTSVSEKRSHNSDKSELYKRKVKKYKKRYSVVNSDLEKLQEELKSYSNQIKNLKSENLQLKEEKTKAIDSNNRITDTLMKKVEYLLEKNREYQKKIYSNDRNADESFKTVDDGDNNLINLKKGYPKGENDFTYGGFDNVKNTNGYKEDFNIGLKANEDKFASSKLDIDYPNYLFKQNDREKEIDEIFSLRQPQSLHGIYNDNSFMNETNQDSLKPLLLKSRDLKPFVLENAYDDKDLGIKNYDKWYNQLDIPLRFTKASDSKNIETDNKKYEANDNIGHNWRNFETKLEDDQRSLDSGKTVQTSNSLKNMIQKTSDLQKKFDDLEKQLEEIKQSDDPEQQKLQDQIKAYTEYYYSDYLDLSNENDIL